MVMLRPIVFQRSLWLCIVYNYISMLFIYAVISADKLYTNEIAVHVQGGIHVAHEIAKRHGFVNNGQIGSLEDHYIFEHHGIAKRSTSHSEEHHVRLKGEEKVLWFEQQEIKSRRKRDLIDISDQIDPTNPVRDPRWKDMWYLIRKNGVVPNMNVVPAWNAGYSGKGVVVTILDDGIESNHSDLIANYDPMASYDINANDSDPFPRYDFTNENKHGTRCAGEVAAMKNHICGIGVAYNANIGGIRMLDGAVTDRVEAASLGHNPQHIDIYSASWGPDDDGKTVDGPGTLTKKVFVDGVKNGRRGLGSIFVWASGNGGRHHDSCNCDGYTNSIWTLSVSSTTESLQKPWYLEECSSTLATTYSSGSFSDKQIISTDLHNKCTDRHTGTSASAPMAAGIVALVLEANKWLTWRDVQYITMRNARPFSDGEWMTNGRGRKVSLRYGYGLMDTSAMVRDAEQWINVPEAVNCTVKSPKINTQFTNAYTETLDTSSCTDSPIIYTEHVQAWISLDYTHRGDVRIILESPSKTKSVLLIRRESDSKTNFENWPFMSVQFWGEDPTGKWTLHVERASSNSRERGKIHTWSLVIHGTTIDPEKRQKYPISPTKCHAECDESGCTGSSATECNSCTNFLIQDTKECVPRCPGHGYAPNPATKICTKCHIGCASCDLQKCIGCKAGYFALDDQCTSQCPQGFLQDSNIHQCVQCSSNCLSCSSPTICTTCDPTTTLVNNECVSSKTCRDHEYQLSSGTCESCHVICGSCTGPRVNECTSCPPDLYLKDGTCKSVCHDGTYSSNHHPTSQSQPSSICKSCHESCVTCVGPSDSECVLCAGLKVNKKGTCVDIETFQQCDIGEYMDASTDTCEPCPSDCMGCTPAPDSHCYSCLSSKTLQNGECVPGCTDGFYESSSNNIEQHPTRICAACHVSCATCVGASDSECVTCAGGRERVDNKCAPKCDIGSYAMKSGECHSCHPDCAACLAGSSMDCTACRADLELVNTACVRRCPHAMFPYGTQCLQCPNGCQECTDKEACLKCLDGWFLGDQSTCQLHRPSNKKCPPHQYVHQMSQECRDCVAPCRTCTGPTHIHCLSCRAPSTFHSKSGECVLCCHLSSNVSHSCCACDKTDSCLDTLNLVVKAPQNNNRHLVLTIIGATLVTLVLIFLLSFIVLQLRSHKRVCWGHKYNRLPVNATTDFPDKITYHDNDVHLGLEVNGNVNGYSDHDHDYS